MGARRAMGSRVASGRLVVALLGVVPTALDVLATMGRLGEMLDLAPLRVAPRSPEFAEREPLLADDIRKHSSWEILIP